MEEVISYEVFLNDTNKEKRKINLYKTINSTSCKEDVAHVAVI